MSEYIYVANIDTNSLTKYDSSGVQQVGNGFPIIDGISIPYGSFVDSNGFIYVSNRQKKGDVIFFDDVTPDKYKEVYKFVNEIKDSKKYSVELISISDERGYAIATKK